MGKVGGFCPPHNYYKRAIIIEAIMNIDSRKYACLKLETLDDVKAIITEVLSEIRSQGMAVEMSGRICNLLQVWLKSHEMSKLEDIERRLDALEEQR
jgi:hypothetical protein